MAPGVTTMDLERAAEKKIKELGAKPAFKGYYDYPCVLCTSVNEEIVHGIPSEKRVLKEGDIVSIDCGVVLDGYYGDAAITVPVGNGLKPELQEVAGSDGSFAVPRNRAGADRQLGWRCWRGGAGACGSRRIQRGARVCRARDRDAVARRAAGSELTELADTARSCAKAWSSRSSRW